MNIIKHNGTAYKLLDDVLMFASLDNDDNIIETVGEEWSEVDFDRMDRIDRITADQAFDYLIK
jgi:hypothetical protein